MVRLVVEVGEQNPYTANAVPLPFQGRRGGERFAVSWEKYSLRRCLEMQTQAGSIFQKSDKLTSIWLSAKGRNYPAAESAL